MMPQLPFTRIPRLFRAILVWSLLPIGLAAFFWLWLLLHPLPLLDSADSWNAVPFSPMVLDRNGQLLRLGLTTDHKYRLRTRLQDISPTAVRAALLYEDRWFYAHPGVNPLSLGRAALSMLWGGRRVGGSTIPMQVARLRFGLNTTTVSGKFHQIIAALQLNVHHSKDAILEAYFTLAPYGGNIEGIGAAAQVYFHRPPSRLTVTESLALAIVPQNPEKRSPLQGQDFDAARHRMRGIWEGTSPQTLPVLQTAPPPLHVYGPAALPFVAPHVSTEALAARSGETRTTLDSSLQQLVETSLTHFVRRGHAYGLRNAAALLVHWPSMEVRALAGSADFHNAAISGQVDGTRARRSPGSTLKPFIYALALDQGLIHPQTLLLDTPQSFRGYNPENFDRNFRGPLPAHAALRASRNIPAIWLASKLQPNLYSLLKRAEVNLPQDEAHYGLSLVLGGAEVTMRELADLYAMLPNKGVWRKAQLFKDSPQGAPARPSRPLLSPEAALVTLFMLEDPGLGLRTRQGFLPLRIKTGTSNGFRDAWTAGVLGPYVLVVWVGNFDNAGNPHLIGGDVALPLFEDMARAIHLREPLTDLVPAQAVGLNLIRIPACTATGDLDTALCGPTTPAWYIPGRSPAVSSGVYRRILIHKPTGLRDCMPSPDTRDEIWEFWPTELQTMFARAGIRKPTPPPFLPQCRPENTESTVPAGSPPSITSPVEGLVYMRPTNTENAQGIPLIAGVDADAEAVFWFLNERFLGQSAPNTPLIVVPEAGEHTLRAVDDLGRASVRKMTVKLQ